MTEQFKVGDIVCFKSSFLRNVGWTTDVPKNGEVTYVSDDGRRVSVKWCDYHDVSRCLSSNIILESEKHLEPV